MIVDPTLRYMYRDLRERISAHSLNGRVRGGVVQILSLAFGASWRKWLKKPLAQGGRRSWPEVAQDSADGADMELAMRD